VLAIQNIANVQQVFEEVHRVLASGGRFVLVLNHPAFRVPKASSWGFDDAAHAQYRRVDKYLSAQTVQILMHPGLAGGPKGDATTLSYHRSLQDYFKAFAKSGFAVTRLEEWISHRTSQRGPRADAEDTARKEIPLFLMLEAQRL
jgi:ubiquinone/menaquinone biosynthesis C-methylase UbiE